MKRPVQFRTHLSCGAAVVAITLAAGSATAQTAPAQAPAQTPAPGEATEVGDVVVTGTSLRGVAPSGTNVVVVTREEIVATGVSNANDLLARVPQITNQFNTVPVAVGGNGNSTVGPNIRNLGFGSSTLVLFNGERVVGTGITSTGVDPSVFPPQVLQGVEVVPDSGSSVYGSDAVGGVINFITRKRYDGLEVVAKAGLGDGYETREVGLLGGRDWGSGSAVLAYNYASHSNLFGADRDYFTADQVPNGGTEQRTLSCTPGNITIGAVNYRMDTRAPGFSYCDLPKSLDLYPAEERHSFYGAFTQALAPNVDFDVVSFYSDRKIDRIGEGLGGNIAGSGTITAANPYFRPIGAEASQNVSFDYSSITGGQRHATVDMTAFGIIPSLTVRLGDNWQVRGVLNYGRSTTETLSPTVNTAAQAAALVGSTTATALNPYNLAATNPAVLANILNYASYGDTVQDLVSARVVADGVAFTNWAGDVRLAVGAEYRNNGIDTETGEGVIGGAPTFQGKDDRTLRSVFAETFVPLLSDASPIGSADINVSIRHDDYDVIGGTTNTKVGVNWRPSDQLRFRGTWGTSFIAPGLSASSKAADQAIQVVPVSPYRAAGSAPFDILRPTIIIAGSNPDLKPEEGESYTLGADWTPSGSLEGFKASVTYYNIQFTNAISIPNILLGPAFYSNPSYAPYFTLSPTQAQVEAAVAGKRLGGASSIASLYGGPFPPYVLLDLRSQNLGTVNVSGLDFEASYRHDLFGGKGSATLGGTYNLERETRITDNDPFQDRLADSTPEYLLAASLGWSRGPIVTSLMVQHTDGFKVVAVPNQTSVDSFTTVNAFVAYTLPDQGWSKGSQLTLNIDNVFDEDPPYFNSPTGYANGQTLGRVFTLGIRKAF
ncbi:MULTISPECIES: TonB-dependent siderophore receptor [unclassified Brevundimonas]|uniref:TonB-dependent receptor plug domain-containing protein n=1 Tax=unclassified Brevundimonas TaxID=2622653 RepID=UPI000CFBC56C|nr:MULTISPECIES: TonB-dependent receptor [unclassified Brevundimonas]PRA27396.1 hypothetical protein CQ024_11480 [Brevundimonas sp. MYb27]PQZ84549.1 hypothetical protein CQ026_01780 [Brevundimonas sp. MYb31]PRB17785.1 hypothetical protein CQ039_01780 [Brevundimonas sp. MYb52]PRB38155.1 hypothetical protein CQ035_01780 [Brevundimonas sp. MYb46]PRB56062.1 hypothetical protein CQ028_01150 [Brevundimonas sp. MYb33]